MIWASKESNRDWCRNFSISSKKSLAFKHVKQCFLTIKASTNKLLLEINLGFMLTIQKQLTNQVNIVKR